MAIAQFLEDFDQDRFDHKHVYLSEEIVEDARLGAFEKGYQAGWDDASSALATEQSHISSELARNLQDINITYQDAYSHVLEVMKPLLTTLVDSALPSLAADTLGARVVEEIVEIIRQYNDALILLTVSSGNRSKIEPLTDQFFGDRVKFLEDPSLGEGQVYLRFSDEERSINLDSLFSEMASTLAGFYSSSKKDILHD
jgi:flagellar assembly protein FliH